MGDMSQICSCNLVYFQKNVQKLLLPSTPEKQTAAGSFLTQTFPTSELCAQEALSLSFFSGSHSPLFPLAFCLQHTEPAADILAPVSVTREIPLTTWLSSDLSCGLLPWAVPALHCLQLLSLHKQA